MIGFDLPGPAVTALRQQGVEMFDDWAACQAAHAGQCDLVTCWHALEHAPNPGAFLDLLTTMLKPGGMLSLEVPDPDLLLAHFRGQSVKTLAMVATFPEHILIASRSWTVAQLAQRGYVIRRVWAPRDGAFYRLYDKVVRRRAPAADRKDIYFQDPPRWQPGLAFTASLVLETVAPLICAPLAYHILAEKR